MDRETTEALAALYRRQLAAAQSDLAALARSSEEFGRRLSSGGEWEDLKPREITRLKESVGEYEALVTQYSA